MFVIILVSVFHSIVVTCSEEKEAVFAEHLLRVRQVVGGPLRSLTLSLSICET